MLAHPSPIAPVAPAALGGTFIYRHNFLINLLKHGGNCLSSTSLSPGSPPPANTPGPTAGPSPHPCQTHNDVQQARALQAWTLSDSRGSDTAQPDDGEGGGPGEGACPSWDQARQTPSPAHPSDESRRVLSLCRRDFLLSIFRAAPLLTMAMVSPGWHDPAQNSSHAIN